MDVTCGIVFSSDSSTMAQLECAVLTSKLEDIEKYSEKLRKKREISPSFWIVLECYVSMHRQIRLHAASLELDLTHLLAYQVNSENFKKLKEKLNKVLMMDLEGGSELELKLAYVLLGVLNVFLGESEHLGTALNYFDKIDFDLSRKFLLYDHGDTEISQSSLVEKIFGILGLFFRGVALEQQGRKEDACEQYQIINDFISRFRVQQFCQAKSVNDFISASLYRSGLLLNQLGRFKESASIFRSFINFSQINPQQQARQPANATIRILRALAHYMDLLDRKFRRLNFKSFCDEQHAIYNPIRESSPWQAENVQEELILCGMLYESIEKPEIVQQALSDFNVEGCIMRRFARIGYLEGISRIQKANFNTKVADLSIYRNLFHSLMSAGKFDQAALAAQIYLKGSGRDAFTMLAIAKFYLQLPSKMEEAWLILDTLLDCEQVGIGLQVPLFLLRGRYRIMKSRKECQFEQTSAFNQLQLAEKEFSLVLQIDDKNPEAHFLLSLVAYEKGAFEESEKLVKRALHLDSSQIRAWYLLALLKSAKKDFDSVLTICGNELQNMLAEERNNLDLSLLRVSTLVALGRSDEAIEALKRIISAHFRNSNESFKMDGGMTVISEGTLGPGNFLSKFLGDLNNIGGIGGFDGSIVDSGEGSLGYLSSSNGGDDGNNNNGNNFGKRDFYFDPSMGKVNTFQAYTEAFPRNLNEFLYDRGDLGDSSLMISSVIPVEDLRAITNSGPIHKLPALWIEVSRVYMQESLLEDSEAAVNQAYQTDEIYAPIFGAFGLIEEIRGGNPEDAVEFYRKGLSIDGEDEICLLGLARINLTISEKDIFDSERLARKLIQKDPNVAEAWGILGQCCARSGRDEAAKEYFEIALEKELNSPLRSIRSISINY